MWTLEEEKVLIDNYENTDNLKLEKMLNNKKSIPSIISKANLMGIKKSKQYITSLRKKLNPKIFWSDECLKYLISNYRIESNNEMSKYLSKSKRSIVRKLRELNIKRTKSEKDFITAKICKSNGRDLSYDFVKDIASKYTSKYEFCLYDNSAYSAALRNFWFNDITKHMNRKGESIPQLILKDILEKIIKCECNFNDRVAICPMEIDCYFENYKMGWEYDGKYYHDCVNTKKINLCNSKGIYLFIIDENSKNYKNYELNIKEQLLLQLDKINEITGLNIIKEDIISCKPILKFSDVLTNSEISFLNGKRLSDVKIEDVKLYRKIIKYKLIKNKNLNIIDDRRKMKKFTDINTYISYIKSRNYKSLFECSKKEHIYRNFRKLGVPISEIKKIWN